MSDYVDRIFAGFIAETEGREIDLTGAYGPQSPDLIIAYIQALTGSGWIFEYPYAVDLWDDRNGSMVDFERVTDWQFKPGDIGVFTQPNGIGTLGILTGISAPGRFKVYTQNPGPAGVTNLRAEDLLGAWRLTAGAACKAIAAEYAARNGYDPTCPPGDLSPYAAWLKPVGDPTIQPGDIVTFGLDGIRYSRPSDYGHVEIARGMPAMRYLFISGRGHGKRAFLARLADSVRGRK